MTRDHKWGDEIRVGDVVLVLGGSHTVTRIDPYGPSNLDFVDERWRVMRSGPDFGMTLDPDAGWQLTESGAWTTSYRRRPWCARCGHQIEWVPDRDENGEPFDTGWWVQVPNGWDACTPGPGDEDRYHEPGPRPSPKEPR